MKLLHKKSILECDETEEKVHHKEVERVMEIIGEMDECAIEVVKFRKDILGQKADFKLYLSKLSDLEILLENADFKNGMDILIDDDFLVFDIHGQSYQIINEQTNEVQSDYIKTRFSVLGLEEDGFFSIANKLIEKLEMEETTMEEPVMELQ